MQDISDWKRPEDDAWMEERAGFESQASSAFVLDLKPAKWHPELVRLRDLLDAADTQSRKRPRSPLDELHSRNGGVLHFLSHRSAPVRFSTGTKARGMALLNAIFYGAEARNMRPECRIGGQSDLTGSMWLHAEGARLNFALREQMEKVHDPYPKEVATGRLRLIVGNHPLKYFRDNPDGTFDDDLNARLFGPMYREILKARWAARKDEEMAIRRAEGQRKLAILYAQREREAAEKKERERLVKLEVEKEEALIAEAKRWEQSALIRAYVASIPPPVDDAWATWALDVAARLDGRKLRQQPC